MMGNAMTIERWLVCHPWMAIGMLAGAGLGAEFGQALALPALVLGGVGLLLGATSGSLADRILRIVSRGPSPSRCRRA